MERKALEQKLTSFFEELHMHPELSYEEYETTERIKRELAAAGIEILQIPLKTGVTAIVRGAKPGKTYGLRCDIDALPIEEETDLPYKSKTPGKMHACGHDFHTAAVFGAALLLQERCALGCNSNLWTAYGGISSGWNAGNPRGQCHGCSRPV